MSISKSDYDFFLPDDLIAYKPVVPRDTSRMMVLGRVDQTLQHNSFTDFPSFLEQGSILVVNNSRVIPARLPGKRSTGGAIEILLISEDQSGIWKCKVKNSARIKKGEILSFCDNSLKAELTGKLDNGECLLRFSETDHLFQSLEKHGFAPLPPYIHKVRKSEISRTEDLQNYQTVFANEYGAIAAPTAGLHFTPQIIERIRNKGIEILEITLHVGLGTFEPIRVDDVRQHLMHKEEFYISKQISEKINQAKKEGRKIVAVGTTSTRTLESAWQNGELQPGKKETDIFIYPPYEFQVVDQLLTNFHLPESTLLMMISAFAGKYLVDKAYRTAIEERYRFYSYGDCMLIQ